MSNIIVVGGGPAGMFASYFAAKAGHKVTLIEKNEKLGLNPQDFLSGSSQKVWWICPKGHEWYQKIYHISINC